MPDREPPRLVVANTDAELERQRAETNRKWAEQEVDWTLRQMAANLIRVVRGAGKPFEIAENAQTFILALVKYREVTGDLDVMDQFPAMLSIGAKDYLRRGLDGAKLDEARAEERAVRGALQVAASRLLGQTTQVKAGEDELSDGARQLVDAYAEQAHERERTAEKGVRLTKMVRPRRRPDLIR
jgi:hypothetical protein